LASRYRTARRIPAAGEGATGARAALGQEIVERARRILAETEALAEAAARANSVRKAIDESNTLGDADIADLFTGISREADKQLWFLEAHLQP